MAPIGLPAIEASAVEANAVKPFLPRHRGHGVGQLNLAARARCLRGKPCEDPRLQDVAADERKPRRRARGGSGFSTMPPSARAPPFILACDLSNSVPAGLGLRNLGKRHDDAAAGPAVNLDELGKARWIAEEQLVGQQHRKRLSSPTRSRAQKTA